MSRQEIERKFYVPESKLKELGLLNDSIQYESRYYLRQDEMVDERVTEKTKAGHTRYQYDYLEEEFADISSRKKESRELTVEEFEEMKSRAMQDMTLERESIKLEDFPNSSVKIYRGRFDGLVRVEFEFVSEEEAKNFQLPEWINPKAEITQMNIGRDGKLLRMTKEEFENELDQIDSLFN